MNPELKGAYTDPNFGLFPYNIDTPHIVEQIWSHIVAFVANRNPSAFVLVFFRIQDEHPTFQLIAMGIIYHFSSD